MHYLSVCAIFKDEGPYLEEWLRFYDLIGVDHFVLYDNGSTDDSAGILAPWIAAGRVTRYHVPQYPVHFLVYHHCLETFKAKSQWIAFVDIDEFLFAPTRPKLPLLLQEFENEAGVVANWVMFGTSGHQHKPPGLVTLNYTRRADTELCMFEPALLKSPELDRADRESYHRICSHVKSIVNTREVMGGGATTHHFMYCAGKHAVNTRREPVAGAFSETIDIGTLRINHYFSRSWEEFDRKLRRGRSDLTTPYNMAEMIERNKLFDAVEDTVIRPLAKQVEGRMGTAVAAAPAPAPVPGASGERCDRA